MRVPSRFIARDLGLVGLAALLWAVLLTTNTTGVAEKALHIVTGLASVIAAATLHEWGHLTGSLLQGSVVHFPDGVFTKLLFDFDVKQNDRKQFLWMSCGGYVGSLIGAVLLIVLLPSGMLASWVAWAGIAIGVAVSFALELPTTIRVWRGAEPPDALLTVSDAMQER